MIYVNKTYYVLVFLSQILITLPKLIAECEKPVFVNGMYFITFSYYRKFRSFDF